MNQCRTCANWGGKPKPIVGFRTGDKKHCSLYTYENNRYSAVSYLEAGDFASSDGSLWTEPDFGCTRWEPHADQNR